MRSLVIVALLASTASAEVDPHFASLIKKAATDYKKWGRVDEEPNLAPTLCRAPLPADYGKSAEVRMSAAEGGPHEHKLFYLWASDKYGYRDHATAKPGFAIVKQSFSTKKHVAKAEKAAATSISYLQPAPITWTKTKFGELEIDQPKDLFVMVKTDETKGTDRGWIYGTVSPDGTVTSAGEVEKCIGCHVEAPHGRLFGLPQ